jgi:Dyp-type peroxidase family
VAILKQSRGAERLERSDIQGLLASAYGHLSCAAYLLLRINDGQAVAAAAWLGDTLGLVTTAAAKQAGWSLNVALTYHGLAALGLDADALHTFPTAFRDGMASRARRRILGDRGDNDASTWRWGGPWTPAIDVVLLLYADRPDHLADLLSRQRARLGERQGLSEVLLLEAGRQPDSREHFGFADGISQPRIEGLDRGSTSADRIKAGEFVLGYHNQYGQPADVPLVSPASDPRNVLPPIDPDHHDLGRNGSYLVFRQLAQDVAGLWTYLDRATRDASGISDPSAQTRLAAKMVGRWPSGTPLVKAPHADPLEGRPGADGITGDNAFGYAEADPHGFGCPVGAHIRRAFPRDALVSTSTSPSRALTSANRHRLLRRGRAYGERLENRYVDDENERGLHFLCFNADLERQFEFVQQTWINNPVFGGLDGEVDPLIGDQSRVAGRMTLAADPVRTRVHGLRQFVTVKGGAYFFLPGLRAIRYLAQMHGLPQS